MAKKKVKKYHKGGSHEDHHTQVGPAPPRNLVGPGGGPPNPNAPKEFLPALPTRKPKQKPVNSFIDNFMPTARPQPITVGGPKQVQPMPAPQRPKVVGVTPRPLTAMPLQRPAFEPVRQIPPRRIAQPARRPTRDQLIDVFGRIINENERQGRTASRVNPNAVLGKPKPRRRR